MSETFNNMYAVTENDTENYKRYSEMSYENQTPSKVTLENPNRSRQFPKFTFSRLRHVGTIYIQLTAPITK